MTSQRESGSRDRSVGVTNSNYELDPKARRIAPWRFRSPDRTTMAAAATPTEPTAPAAAPAPIITISYHDLASFHPLEEASHERNQRLMDSIGAAFGADGLGILAVLHVPDFTELRQALLPLAARLPTLPDIDQLVHEESLYSTGWSHGKECLVVPQGDGPNSTKVQPDNAKGSFYANPLTDDLVRACRDRQDKLGSHETLDWEQLGRDHPDFFAPNLWPRQSLPQLEQAFVAMGKAIHATGCLLAGVCDAYCQAQGVTLGLQETLTRSLNAKGRLLHYFAVGATDHGGTDPGTALWCGWHKDHGTFRRRGTWGSNRGSLKGSPGPWKSHRLPDGLGASHVSDESGRGATKLSRS